MAAGAATRPWVLVRDVVAVASGVCLRGLDLKRFFLKYISLSNVISGAVDKK